MKLVNKITFIAILIIILSKSLYSQPWLHSPYLDDSKTKHTFYDIQEAFNKWAENKDLSETKGIKSYKRWEWFYEPRVYPTGEMPDRRIYWEESLKHRNFHKSVNSSSNWTSISPATIPVPSDTMNIIGMGRINCITFHPTDTNTLWIGSSSGGVWKTTDNGATWTCLTDMIPVLRVSDIAVDPNNTDVLYISTGDINTIMLGNESNEGIGVLKSTDGGTTWNTTGLSFNLTDGLSSLIRKVVVNPANSNELVAAGYDGIYKSFDGGTTWTKTDSNIFIDLKVNPVNNNTLYAATYYNAANGSSQRIYRSYDFGDTWEELNTGMPLSNTVLRIELAIAPSDTNYIYALACDNNNGFYGIYKSTDAGQNWSMVAAYDTTGHPGAALAPNILGWGDGGMSGFMPDEGGQGTYDLTLVVDPHNKDFVYSGGVNMWGSDDGGITWDIVSMWYALFDASIHADQHYSKYNPLSKRLYQAHDGGIDYTDTVIIGDFNYIYNNCVNWPAVLAGDYANALYLNCYSLPTQWTNITHGLHITEYYKIGLCKSNPDIIVGGAQDNGTYMYDNGSWISTLGGDGMEAMIAHDNDSIIYATNYNGALSRSDDRGITYTSGLEQPITDAGETGAWVTPFVMHPVNSDIIYTGFHNVWKSPDKGVTWTALGSISGTASLVDIAVAPSDPDSTFYCAQTGNIYKTNDAGGVWTNIKAGLPYAQAAITKIAVNDTNPNHLWVSFSGYIDGEKVYVSEDGGATWVNISAGLPNVPVNCIVYENGTTNGITGAIYAGTDIGVYYTNDSILATPSKWIEYSTNLPNVVVSELEIHYGSKKLRAATYGRGIWESPLYVAGNAGNINATYEAPFDLKIYPNPTNGMFTISAKFDKKQNIEINIFSLKGDKIISYSEISKGDFSKKFDMSNFAKGPYFIKTTIEKTSFTTRIIKK